MRGCMYSAQGELICNKGGVEKYEDMPEEETGYEMYEDMPAEEQQYVEEFKQNSQYNRRTTDIMRSRPQRFTQESYEESPYVYEGYEDYAQEEQEQAMEGFQLPKFAGK